MNSNERKRCTKCNVQITKSNWARHLKSRCHLANNPERTMPVLRRGRPKTVRLHREMRFYKSLFEEPRVRTIVRVKHGAFPDGRSNRFRLRTLEILNTQNFCDIRRFLNSVENAVVGNIQRELRRHNYLKVNNILYFKLKRGEELYQITLRTRNEIITPATNFNEFYAALTQTLLNKIEEFQIRSSQWILNRILSLEMGINRYNPLRGRSYVPLPSVLANKKAIINVQNKDNMCFLWAILSALHPADHHVQRVSKYRQWEHEFDFALMGIEFPVELTDVPKFAK